MGNTHIIVPVEETGDWSANWRYEVASAVASDGITPPNPIVAKDPWIDLQSHYLQVDLDYYDGEVPDECLRPYHIAASWFANTDINSPRFRIEPLLLTGAPFDTIAADMGVSESAVQVYERLYYNTRNDDGSLLKGCYNRSRLAFDANQALNEHTGDDVIWRVIGFSLGYEALVQLWHWDNHASGLDGSPQGLFDEIWRYTQASLLYSLVRNEIRPFDINNLMSNHIQNKRMMFDTKQHTGDSMASAEIIMGMLHQVRPHINPAAKTVDGDNILEQTELIAAKLNRERQIQGEKLKTSVGTGGGTIDKMIRESATMGRLEDK